MTQAQPVFDPNAAHQQKPKLRPVRAFPAQFNQQMVMGLADARQISERVVFTSPAAQHLLPLMDGTRGLDEIVGQVGRGLTRPILEQLVAQLDDAALLFGPKYEALLAKTRAEFDAAPNLPPGSTAAFADALVVAKRQAEAQQAGKKPEEVQVSEEEKVAEGPGLLAQAFEQWIAAALKDAKAPAFDSLPKAVLAPHIDYARGWVNYAHVWGRMRVVDRPDRVIILGTNHFGEATGVCGCDKGYQTPLGVSPVDVGVRDGLRKRLGDKLFAHRFDHEREHSIELQVAWVQHALGKNDQGQFVPVFGALVHDPVVNGGESYDGQGVGMNEFVEAVRETIASLPGRTLVVSSADLSHAGPAFGDQQVLAGDGPAEQFRNKVFQHDREMLELYRQGKHEDLIASMSWQQNPTRWCSVGNMTAAMRIVGASGGEILNYGAAMDEQGMSLVSTAAMVLA